MKKFWIFIVIFIVIVMAILGFDYYHQTSTLRIENGVYKTSGSWKTDTVTIDGDTLSNDKTKTKFKMKKEYVFPNSNKLLIMGKNTKLVYHVVKKRNVYVFERLDNKGSRVENLDIKLEKE